MKKVFILGSTGYVGNHLKSFLNEDFSVVTAGRKNSDIHFDLESGEFGGLLDQVKKDDTIIFLSAVSAPDQCENNFEVAYTINVKNTIILISGLLQKKARVIFSSSDVVFGATSDVCHEMSERKPFGKYGQMKYEIEEYFKNTPDFFIIRFSYILGKGDKFSEMVKEYSLNSKILDVFDGFERSVVSIDDVLLGVKNIISNWNQIDTRVVNFSGPGLVSRQQIVLALAQENYPGLQYQFTEAPESFWLGRPKIINTKSRFLESILDRSCESYLNVIKG